MLAFAIPAMFTAISFFFLKLSDRFFLLHYQGIAVVGLYTVANSLSQPLYIVGMAFRMAWPQWHYAKLQRAREAQAHGRPARSTYFMAFNGVLLVLVGIYLPLVIHVLLNEEFWSVGPTTFVLTLSVALYNLYFIFWIGANVAKKNRLIPRDHAGRLGRQRRPQLPARARRTGCTPPRGRRRSASASSPCSCTSSPTASTRSPTSGAG